MKQVIQSIRNLFGSGPNQEILPPDSKKAGPVMLREQFEVNGNQTTMELRPGRLVLHGGEEEPPQLLPLTDSLEGYQALDFELRLQLGRRIAGLLPELAHSKHALLLDHTAKLLGTIARDQSERVRIMLAEEIAEQPDAPYEVIKQLAQDASAAVACPIIEYSPLLSDLELIELLSTSSVPGVAEAIARRSQVSETVSTAIVHTGQPRAIGLLLANDGAEIDEEAMDTIIDLAPKQEVWHESLVARPELTQKTIARIAGFVSQELLMQLEDGGNLKRLQKQDARAAVQHRLGSWTEDQLRQAEQRVRQLHAAGRLDDETIDTAIHQPDAPFVVAALTQRTLFRREKVQKLLRSGSARAITALAWEAGLPMRSATALQMKIGQIHHSKLLHARGGTDYPLREEEMETYLEIMS